MKKRKELNKNGLKLSLICGLNWFIKFLFKGQFYLLTTFFSGLIIHYYIPHSFQQIIVTAFKILVIIKCLESLVFSVISIDIRRMKPALQLVVLLLFFSAGNYYMAQYSLTEFMNTRIFTFWFISFVIVGLVTLIQPRLFKHYLFKNIINKEYLGIRKFTDDLPPEINFYNDESEADADKRMRLINQNVIKQPYQDVVGLSFLNKEVTTGIHHKIDLFTKEKEQIFEDVDTIYYLVFIVYPFGIKEDFSYKLTQLELSRKDAFTKNGEGLMKKDF